MRRTAALVFDGHRDEGLPSGARSLGGEACLCSIGGGAGGSAYRVSKPPWFLVLKKPLVEMSKARGSSEVLIDTT